MNLKAWEEFCDELKNLGGMIDKNAPDNLSRNEGYRYLLRLLRLSSEMNFEHSFPHHPSFYSLSNETAKIGGDNPDNVYLNANLNPAQSYKISGNFGEVEYLSIGIKQNRYHIDGTMISHAELEITSRDTDQNGNFSVLISQDKNADLRMRPDSNMLIVRETYRSKMNDKRATINIEAIHTDFHLPILSDEDLHHKLKMTLNFVAGTASTFLKWTGDFKLRHLNALPLGDQEFFQAAGGDPSIIYLHGYYKIEPNECLVIKTTIPDCQLWNFQLENFWMESLDYRFNKIHINNSNAKLNNKELVIHVTHRDENLLNNLITQDHTEGAMLLRWINCKCPSIPNVSLVKLSELK
ncbi:MAG: hypothetical protein VW146_00505 [Gammaproteobacteria bacterium]